MAYTVVMEKKNVSQQGGYYRITITCTVNDGTNDVFTEDITASYHPNSTDLETMKAGILEELKIRWDKYVDEKGIADSAAMDTALGEMQTQATAYVNG